MKISVGWITRKRSAQFVYSVCSFIQNARQPQLLELLFSIDDDDAESEKAIKDMWPFINLSGCRVIIIKSKRMGYQNMDKYHRNAGKRFTGDCFLMASDDVICFTDGWDDVVRKAVGPHLNEPCLIQTNPVEDRHKFWPTFPGITRKWWDVTKNIMIYTAGDGYLHEITEELKLRRIRPDYEVHQLSRNALRKGDNWTEPDATQLEGRGYEGSEKRRGSKDDDGIHTRARDVENLNKWKRGKGNYSWPKEDTYQQ